MKKLVLLTTDLEERLPEFWGGTELLQTGNEEGFDPASFLIGVVKSNSSLSLESNSKKFGYFWRSGESSTTLILPLSSSGSLPLRMSLSNMLFKTPQASVSIACISSHSSVSCIDSANAARKSSPQCSTVIKSRPSSPEQKIKEEDDPIITYFGAKTNHS